MPVVLLRIDDRLIHGQVTVSWTRYTNSNVIVVANDEIANDVMRKMLIESISSSKDVSVKVLSIEDTVEKINSGEFERDRVMIIVVSPKDALRIVRGSAGIKSVNLGQLAYKEGKIRVTNTISLGFEDIQAILSMIEEGISVVTKQLPQDRNTDIKSAIERAVPSYVLTGAVSTRKEAKMEGFDEIKYLVDRLDSGDRSSMDKLYMIAEQNEEVREKLLTILLSSIDKKGEDVILRRLRIVSRIFEKSKDLIDYHLAEILGNFMGLPDRVKRELSSILVSFYGESKKLREYVPKIIGDLIKSKNINNRKTAIYMIEKLSSYDFKDYSPYLDDMMALLNSGDPELKESCLRALINLDRNNPGTLSEYIRKISMALKPVDGMSTDILLEYVRHSITRYEKSSSDSLNILLYLLRKARDDAERLRILNFINEMVDESEVLLETASDIATGFIFSDNDELKRVSRKILEKATFLNPRAVTNTVRYLAEMLYEKYVKSRGFVSDTEELIKEITYDKKGYDLRTITDTLKMLESPRWKDRAYALRDLSRAVLELGMLEEHLPKIIELIFDDVKDVRIEAIRLVGAIGYKEPSSISSFVPYFMDLLEDDDRDIRYESLRILELIAMKSPESLSSIMRRVFESFDDRFWDIQSKAAEIIHEVSKRGAEVLSYYIDEMISLVER
ncbi:MAG: PTS sugar transporter subunit IIB [Candidatus Odinarchaeota archaeon]|nr:PTS sugar transporter subunit IIB [Candidatus Odinarchaeota archaeon]